MHAFPNLINHIDNTQDNTGKGPKIACMEFLIQKKAAKKQKYDPKSRVIVHNFILNQDFTVTKFTLGAH